MIARRSCRRTTRWPNAATASTQVDELRKKIVATKEGGMITGEERLRENLADLYGNVIFYGGRPTQMQIARTDALDARAGGRRRGLRCVVARDFGAVKKN